MDRRNTLKSLLVGSMAGGLMLQGCDPNTEQADQTAAQNPAPGYGRTPDEIERDARINGEQFFNEHELTTVAVLCDLILPATETAGSATDAGVPEFIEFIAKDMTYNQLPLRGGIMWIDQLANKKFGMAFEKCSVDQQKEICDLIAYPKNFEPEMGPGVKFFSLMRNLTLTGYYTTRMGIDDLGYVGNSPNVWDGVPDDVLEKHGLAYEKEWLEKCVDQSKREDVAKWDDDGNLIS